MSSTLVSLSLKIDDATSVGGDIITENIISNMKGGRGLRGRGPTAKQIFEMEVGNWVCKDITIINRLTCLSSSP